MIELPLPIAWLDLDAGKVLRRLRHCDYVAYLVGGCVRDLLLGRYPKDFDIATSALPREVKRAFSNCRLIGRRFRLAHILFQNNIIEVATFRRDPGNAEPEEDALDREDDWPARRRRQGSSGEPASETVEAAEDELEADAASDTEGDETEQDATPDEEIDGAVGDDASDESGDSDREEDLLIRSDNVFGTPEEDARRRDFTINGLFYDVSTQSLIDWVGGLRDVEARVIRTIGVPEIRFREDPVRMLRAIKFAAALRFTIEPRTWTALCLVAPDITRSAAPRILEEVFRMMRGGAAGACFRLLALGGVLKHILPELAPLVELELAAAATGSVNSEHALRLSMGSSEVSAGGSSEESVAHQLEDGARPARGGEGPALAGVLAYLQAIDQVDQVGMPLPNHLLLALLAQVPVFRMLKLEGGSTISDQVFRKAGFLLEEMATRLRIARRDRERARLVLLGLTKIVWRTERGTSLAALTRKSYFPESFILYCLHCLALGTGAEDIRRLARRMTLTPEVMRVLDAVQARFPEGSTAPAQAAAVPADAGGGAGRSRRRRRSRRRGRGGGAREGGDQPSSQDSGE